MHEVPSSFRDPSGHLFWEGDRLYRTVTDRYIDTYQALKRSGLLDILQAEKKIVEFKEHSANAFSQPHNGAVLILEPKILPFISYPYEWSFSQLKDAALLTLDLHIQALKNGFLLKDSSAYNIQFLRGKPIFIDHLSFDPAEKYDIWPAYGQFCRHFLAPLALMAKIDPGLNGLLKLHVDGIPLPLACKLLPMRKLLNFGFFIHLWAHAKFQKKYADKGHVVKKMNKLSHRQMLDIAQSLTDTVTKLRWNPNGTEWIEYYDNTNYSDTAMRNKIDIVTDFVQKVSPISTVWDFGGNTGDISRAIQTYADHIVCFDVDAAAVESNYLQVKKNKETKMLPLVMDFSNPSSDVGFASKERLSLNQRGKADLIMALALIHHLAISNNLPLNHVAKYLASLCRHLIIEFIPKEDSQVQRLLLSREDIFDDYTQDHFVGKFSSYFEIKCEERVRDSTRTLYLMKTIPA